MYDRRQVLGALGTASTALLAGCGGSGGSGPDYATPGETRELSGIEFTVTGVSEFTGVDLAVEAENQTETGTETGTVRYETTRFTAGTDTAENQRRLLVVDLTGENVTESEQGLPAPAPKIPAAAGRITITGTGRGINPQSVQGQLVRDGGRRESFGERVADLDWTLAPGESVSGWLLFRVREGFDRVSNTLTVEIDATTARWQLQE